MSYLLKWYAKLFFFLFSRLCSSFLSVMRMKCDWWELFTTFSNSYSTLCCNKTFFYETALWVGACVGVCVCALFTGLVCSSSKHTFIPSTWSPSTRTLECIERSPVFHPPSSLRFYSIWGDFWVKFLVFVLWSKFAHIFSHQLWSHTLFCQNKKVFVIKSDYHSKFLKAWHSRPSSVNLIVWHSFRRTGVLLTSRHSRP